METKKSVGIRITDWLPALNTPSWSFNHKAKVRIMSGKYNVNLWK